MFKRALVALAMVGMAATPTAADLLVPDDVINPPHLSQAGTIGIFGASVNGNPVASPGFLGSGVASQVSIPANPSDTIVITFAFHWPFSTYFARPYLGLQFQNRLVYDNSEVQILGATGAGGWTPENFGLGPNNSKMIANGPFTTTSQTASGMTVTNMYPGTSTTIGISGTPLKGFPNPSSGIQSPQPGHNHDDFHLGLFAVNAPITTIISQRTSRVGGGIGDGMPIATPASGMFIPFSSTFPIMKVTLHVKSAIQDGSVDLRIPQTSAFLLFKVVTTSVIPAGSSFPSMTTTNTFAGTRTFFSGSAVGTTGMGGNNSFGASIVPEPASATLLGIGLFCLVGGAWRHRRRFGEV